MTVHTFAHHTASLLIVALLGLLPTAMAAHPLHLNLDTAKAHKPFHLPWRPAPLPTLPTVQKSTLGLANESSPQPPASTTLTTEQPLLQWWWQNSSTEIWLPKEAQQMVAVALQQHPSVEAAYQRWQQVHQQSNLQRSTLLPLLSLNPSLNRQHFSANQFVAFNNSSANRTFDFYSLPIQFRWELDVWGRLTQQLNAVKRQEAASHAQWQWLQLNLASDTLSTYWQWQTLHQQTLAQHALVETLQHQRDYAAALVSIGQTPRNTLLLRDGLWSDSQRQLTLLATAERLLARRLGTLLGKESEVEPQALLAPWQQPRESLRWEGYHQLPALPSLPEPALWLERRADLVAQRHLLEASKLNVKAIHKLILPRVFFNGEWGFLSTTTGNLLDWKSHAYQLIPQLAQPLFAGGQIKATQRLLVAQLAEQVATYQDNLLQALQELEQAQLAYQRDFTQCNNLQQQLYYKWQERQLQEQRIAIGSAPVATRWPLEEQYWLLEQQWLQARLALQLDTIQLQRHLGGLAPHQG